MTAFSAPIAKSVAAKAESAAAGARSPAGPATASATPEVTAGPGLGLDFNEVPVMPAQAGAASLRPDASGIPVSPAMRGVLTTSGRPLDPGTRVMMEGRFGHDFSRVRVHTDPAAGESARAINADAYTMNEHIVFDAGRYVPDSHQGRRLLAHELSHVVQQGRGAGAGGSSPRELDREAEHVADALVRGASRVALSGAGAPAILRSGADGRPAGAGSEVHVVVDEGAGRLRVIRVAATGQILGGIAEITPAPGAALSPSSISISTEAGGGEPFASVRVQIPEGWQATVAPGAAATIQTTAGPGRPARSLDPTLGYESKPVVIRGDAQAQIGDVNRYSRQGRSRFFSPAELGGLAARRIRGTEAEHGHATAAVQHRLSGDRGWKARSPTIVLAEPHSRIKTPIDNALSRALKAGGISPEQWRTQSRRNYYDSWFEARARVIPVPPPSRMAQGLQDQELALDTELARRQAAQAAAPAANTSSAAPSPQPAASPVVTAVPSPQAAAPPVVVKGTLAGRDVSVTATVGGKEAGRLVGRYSSKTRRLHVSDIRVADEYKGRGIGGSLYEEAIEAISRSNPGAGVDAIEAMMAGDNLARARAQGITSTHAYKTRERLGYTLHEYDEANFTLVSRRSPVEPGGPTSTPPVESTNPSGGAGAVSAEAPSPAVGSSTARRVAPPRFEPISPSRPRPGVESEELGQRPRTGAGGRGGVFGPRGPMHRRLEETKPIVSRPPASAGNPAVPVGVPKVRASVPAPSSAVTLSGNAADVPLRPPSPRARPPVLLPEQVSPKTRGREAAGNASVLVLEGVLERLNKAAAEAQSRKAQDEYKRQLAEAQKTLSEHPELGATVWIGWAPTKTHPDSANHPRPEFHEVRVEYAREPSFARPSAVVDAGHEPPVYERQWIPPSQPGPEPGLDSEAVRKKVAGARAWIDRLQSRVDALGDEGRVLRAWHDRPFKLDTHLLDGPRSHVKSAEIAVEQGRVGDADLSLQAARELLRAANVTVDTYEGKPSRFR